MENDPGRGNVATDDRMRDRRDDAADAVDDFKDDAGDAAERAADKARGAGNKLTDAVEDMIPGDSDHDGH